MNLILIHGAGDSGRVWQPTLACLGAAHAIHAIDLPGHGTRLSERAFNDHALNADEVLRLMDQAGLESAVIGGQSMGAAIALLLALNHPGRVRAVMLIGGGARLRTHPLLLQANERFGEDLRPLDRPFTGPDIELRPGAPVDARVAYCRLAGQAHGQAVYADLLANNSFDVMARVAHISVPALVIVGSEDRMTPPKFAEYLANNIPGARLSVLANCGHYPQIEQPDAFHAELGHFLEDLEPRTSAVYTHA